MRNENSKLAAEVQTLQQNFNEKIFWCKEPQIDCIQQMPGHS